jgi:hypothetical protein
MTAVVGDAVGDIVRAGDGVTSIVGAGVGAGVDEGAGVGVGGERPDGSADPSSVVAGADGLAAASDPGPGRT